MRLFFGAASPGESDYPFDLLQEKNFQTILQLFHFLSQTRRGGPIDCRHFPMKLLQWAKLALSGKIIVTFEPVVQFKNTSGLRMS